MKRRTFLKAAGATILIPSVPVAAKPKPEKMTLEVFCRDVLKVKLTPDEQDYVYVIGRGLRQGYRHVNFGEHETKLAAYTALWAAYTHPENMVWIHGMWNRVFYGKYVFLSAVPVVPEEVYIAYEKNIWPIEHGRWSRRVKPGDFHIYV